MMDRRKFLGLGTAAAAGLGRIDRVMAKETATAPGTPRIRRHVTLGRTGLVVSDISFGSSSLSDPRLVRHALDRGVTFFDTAESYRFGNAETAIGKALVGLRDRVVLSSKTKAGASDSQSDMMTALESSLRRLRTDYLDIYFNHAVNSVDRMANTEWWEFTERAKAQGKIRFRGLSGHGGRLAPCLDYALDHDLADVILVAFSFAQDPDFYARLRHTFHFVAIQPDLPRVLDKARQKKVGVLAMKTLMGARLNDMRPYERAGGTFAQAAFRWVLSSPRVDGLLISMTSTQVIDEYVAASGEAEVRGEDLRLLARYAGLQDARYCRPSCDVCEGACPEGVDIAEVLRTRMYDVDYGDSLLAKTDYARLEGGAEACLTCAHQACFSACPHGIPIPDFTRDAARRLG